MADLHANGDVHADHVQKTFLEIQEAVRNEASVGECGWLVGLKFRGHFIRLCRLHIGTGNVYHLYRKRTVVGITAQMFAQLNGINVISFYLPSSLSAAGFQ